MGFFKQMRELRKQAEAMQPQEYKGLGGLMNLAQDGMAQASAAMSGLAEMQDRSALAESGLAGRATVTGLRQTNAFLNNNPVCDIDLTVALPDREPYAVTVRQVVSIAGIPQVQPGCEVAVRVDADDPQSVLVVRDA